MKNIKKIFAMVLFILISLSSLVLASEEYILEREMVYTNNGKAEIKEGYVEIMIGQKNFTEYQKDGDIVITPAPDELREDEYGNLFAYYDFSGYNPGRTLKVTVKRYFEAETYIESISVRSESTVNEENAIYVEEQARVESENGKIISKAKELTEGVSSDYKRALELFKYVNTTLEYNTASQYANKGSVSAIENEKGVCEEFATLYAALCRAVDIPCKVVEGYTYQKIRTNEDEIVFDNLVGEYVQAEPIYEYQIVNHVWNEIYLDDYGWVPVDACVMYPDKTNREAYTDAFCAILSEEYIATGIYNYEKPNRLIKGLMTEVSYTEKMYPSSSVVKEEHSFTDIGTCEWAEDSINNLYEMGIIKGYTDTEYGPKGNVSRIEFIALLARVLKSINYQPVEGGMVYYFMDYDKEHYSKEDYDYLMRCLEIERPFDKFAIGYYAMSSIFGNSLEMNKPITRGEAVALMDYFLKYDVDVYPEFTDIYDSRFRSSILKAYSNGLITGYEDNTFRPNGTITRAEIAVILDRYIGVEDYVI